MNNRVSSIPNTVVTGDDRAVIAGVLAWFVRPDSSQHCTITGGPGAGKTTMIKKLMETYGQLTNLGMVEVEELSTSSALTVCGTTHHSISVLKEDLELPYIATIFRILGLKPVKGVIHKKQGRLSRPASYNPTKDEQDYKILNLVCDESNYITQETLTLITKWFPNVRIIFVGSENQLGSDKGKSKIFVQGWDNFFLNTTYRADNEDVQAVYDNSENDVVAGGKVNFIANASIIYQHQEDWEANIKAAYTSPIADKCITLAYTNKRVFELVGMIRALRGKEGFFDMEGPTQALILGSSLIPKKLVPLEKDAKGEVYIEVIVGKQAMRSYVGESYEHYLFLKSKDHRRRGDEIFPSLVASMEASTVHGAQGGTWDYTFLDIANMSALQWRDMETYRRMKHVAESRHRTKIFVKTT